MFTRVALALSLPAWLIFTPGTKPVYSTNVLPIPAIAFLERVVIGLLTNFGTWPLPRASDELNHLATEGPILNLAL